MHNDVPHQISGEWPRSKDTRRKKTREESRDDTPQFKKRKVINKKNQKKMGKGNDAVVSKEFF